MNCEVCNATEELELCPECGKLFCQAHWSVYDLDDDGNELIACFSCDHKHPMNKAENHYWDCPPCLSAEGQPECAEFNRLSEQDERARAIFLAELAERKGVRS